MANSNCIHIQQIRLIPKEHSVQTNCTWRPPTLKFAKSVAAPVWPDAPEFVSVKITSRLTRFSSTGQPRPRRASASALWRRRAQSGVKVTATPASQLEVCASAKLFGVRCRTSCGTLWGQVFRAVVVYDIEHGGGCIKYVRMRGRRARQRRPERMRGRLEAAGSH